MDSDRWAEIFFFLIIFQWLIAIMLTFSDNPQQTEWLLCWSVEIFGVLRGRFSFSVGNTGGVTPPPPRQLSDWNICQTLGLSRRKWLACTMPTCVSKCVFIQTTEIVWATHILYPVIMSFRLFLCLCPSACVLSVWGLPPIPQSVGVSGDGNPFFPYSDSGGEIRQTLGED